MRLTWKLSMALALGVLCVLVGYGVYRVDDNVARFRRQAELSHAQLARTVSAALGSVDGTEGDARARELASTIAHSVEGMTLTWRDGTDADRVEGPRFAWIETTPPTLVTATIMSGSPPRVLEIGQRLDREIEVRHEAAQQIAFTTSIVLILCIGLILSFGVVLVGRPLDALRRHAERVGRGERGVQTAIDSKDEIGDLASAMNAMTRGLDDAAEQVRREEAARLSLLEQLHHADRLRVVGEIAASVAHDLGTPMASARARAQLIAGGDVDAKRGRELGASIMGEIDRMSDAIRLLLDHARRDPPAPRDTDVAALVEEVRRLFAPIAESRGLSVEVGLPRAPVTMRLDPSQIRHVLINLVSNALDASPEHGEVRIDVQGDETTWTIAVSDRGPGIAPEQRAQVFEPFFTTKPTGRGTGLGLSVARTIVESHRGTLRCEPREGGGTRFGVTLPR